MPKLVIIRHGNTFDKGDTILRVGARTDLPLSVSGNRQAAELAGHLLGVFPDVAHIYTGALKRQQQTAQIIHDAYRLQPSLTQEHLLQEIDYGADDGLPETDIVAKHGEEVLARWESDNIVPEGWLACPDNIRQSWREFADAIRKSYADDAVIFAVTSNGTARFAPEALLIEAEQPAVRKLRTAAYGVLCLSKNSAIGCDGWNIRSL